eukprot:CAMPEP_0175961872 /NCGR_PEP_ID=MMETSP0108-20121206/36170_1 /TAXON_ID=195067 ORGANISM="Goniomonas pacifica, Strain CCMP1869" /NCGR_SAMPLE_ID=MMETSP0108 /ASSEMBLY_ACC=CAM_ASM_000204 /LENGTH=35 /DNA_ID= /DNA_START= /DNA_END= /DNA_ORIENTATION=
MHNLDEWVFGSQLNKTLKPSLTCLYAKQTVGRPKV